MKAPRHVTLNIFLKDNLFPKSLSLLNMNNSCGRKIPASDLEVNEHWEKYCGHASKYLFVIDVHK